MSANVNLLDKKRERGDKIFTFSMCSFFVVFVIIPWIIGLGMYAKWLVKLIF
jgi:hypothetical protein